MAQNWRDPLTEAEDVGDDEDLDEDDDTDEDDDDGREEYCLDSKRHLNLRCFDAEQRHCFVCAELEAHGRPLKTVYEEEDLCVEQFLDDFEAPYVNSLVRGGVLPSGACINAGAGCDLSTHRKENLIILCPIHSEIFRSNLASDPSDMSMVFVPPIGKIFMMIDEEIKEQFRFRAWRRQGRPAEDFAFRSMDDIARYRNFDLSFDCVIARSGEECIRIKVDLPGSPIFPVLHFSRTVHKMSRFEYAGQRSVYPEDWIAELREIAHDSRMLDQDWYNRVYASTAWSRIQVVDQVVRYYRRHWLAAHPHVALFNKAADLDAEEYLREYRSIDLELEEATWRRLRAGRLDCLTGQGNRGTEVRSTSLETEVEESDDISGNAS